MALALRQYESFAIHRQVTVLTDNSRVLHVDKWRCVNARERRLITYLMQFRLRIKYIRGCNNASADYLSRMYQDMSEEDRAQFLPEQAEQDDFIVPISEYRLTNEIDESSHHISSLNPHAEEFSPAENQLCITSQESDHTPNTSYLRTDDADLDGVASLYDDGNNQTGSTDVPDLVAYPTIQALDFEQDSEFGDMYLYLKYGTLTGDDARDRLTLLLADHYILSNEFLYKLATQRTNKQTATCFS